MIRLSNVSKAYRTSSGLVSILEDVNLEVSRGEALGILGRNGAGKSTLIRIIGGAELPDSGTVERTMSVSWPLAFGGGFQSALTGLDNLKFICRIYGVDPASRIEFVDDFAELGAYLKEPVKSYSSGMRARLAFAASMVIDFDCYLIDEIVAVGDSRFQAKCREELFVKRADRSRIFVSHDPEFIRSNCDRAAVIANRKLLEFASIDDAYDFYSETIS